MSDDFDALSVRIGDSRALVGDAVSRVVVSETVSADCVTDTTLEETLGRVAGLANETISGSVMVSMTLLVEGRPRTVAFTDDTEVEIDDVQCSWESAHAWTPWVANTPNGWTQLTTTKGGRHSTRWRSR